MIGSGEALGKVLAAIKAVAGGDSTVLITGESGTGKELVARAIHEGGARKEKPFIAVDSAAIPEDLVESELFGHEKGAFTDAAGMKPGKFELADTGTLFLDEVGNLHPDVQSKLLRAIEEREFQRVGGTRTIKTDVRIIAATNIDLAAAVKQGRFRQDLYYRLNVIPIVVPPLRDRKEDIPLLAAHFKDIFNKKFGKSIKEIVPGAMGVFSGYDWPGNVRELRNVMERLVALEKGETITEANLPAEMIADSSGPDDAGLKSSRDEFERQFIVKALKQSGWNQTQAAKLLGIHRNALMYKMEKHKITH
jgi:transcriptional regulator with GAF, ATPase, and Fis domain